MTRSVFPIRSLNRLADLLKCPKEKLVRFADNPAVYYRPMLLERAGKEPRPIQVPMPELADLQRRILDRVFLEFQPHHCSFGGVKGRSAADNARSHLDKRFVLRRCTDLTWSFFETSR